MALRVPGVGGVHLFPEATPAAPPSGTLLYTKAGGGLFYRNAGGAEIQVPTTGGGGGSTTTYLVELDVGQFSRAEVTTTVTDAAITPTSKLKAWQAGEAATGKQADENEMEQFSVTAIPLTGSATFVLNAYAGSMLQGNHKVYYQIG